MPKAYKFTDKNGKAVEFDLNEIVDMVTAPGSLLADGETPKPVAIRFTDHAGNVIDPSKITDAVGSNDPIVALDVTFESTHSGKNLNHAIYHSDSMAKDAVTFLVPFAKPLIKNHDLYEEPMGRAVGAVHGPSKLHDEKDTIAVTFRITDTDAIPKFIDGRYRTMSIGATANHVKCEICGNDLVKDGQFKKFCGHWRGETYNDQVCYWTSRDMVYKEGSVVNNPADQLAQIIEIKAYTQSQLDAVNNSSDASMSQSTEGNEEDAAKGAGVGDVADSVASIIDGVLAEEEAAGSEGEAKDGDGNGESSADNGEGEAKAGEAGKEGDAQNGVSDLAKLQVQLDAETEQRTVLELKVTDLEGQLQEKAQRITDLESEVATEVAARKVSDEQATVFRKQAVQLAIKAKTDLIDKIVGTQVADGTVKAEEVEATKDALKMKTMKELEDMLKPTEPRTIAKVENPGTVNTEDEHAVKEEEAKAKSSVADKAKTKSVEDSFLSNRFGL